MSLGLATSLASSFLLAENTYIGEKTIAGASVYHGILGFILVEFLSIRFLSGYIDEESNALGDDIPCSTYYCGIRALQQHHQPDCGDLLVIEDYKLIRIDLIFVSDEMRKRMPYQERL